MSRRIRREQKKGDREGMQTRENTSQVKKIDRNSDRYDTKRSYLPSRLNTPFSTAFS